ncbi:hypothetical protein DC498_21240 [Terrimonas sp.]|uniref:AAA family ATPase n=1 Tax=Terrimonas sp. TaxID=1914338 RepID=UPI000D513DF7|nr:AAA family ATPase [Terrimonas sp.]PVD50142.1 hypothetical protein DC498_21240 [Terrimonas sp.]
MKINKIRIQNFKVFKDITLDFNSSDIIVFDGPNGFGKTTIYDAIELVFTGKIRRYNDLKLKLIDGRQSFSENPFQHANAQDGDIVITIEFAKNEQIYVLERLAQVDTISPYIDFSIYKLFTKDDFSSVEKSPVDNEELFLAGILGKNYNSNFQFLNYVEQEECLFLLKHKDSTRKSHIGHLFDLKEFEEKIKRIENLKKRIDTIFNNNFSEAESLAEEIDRLKESLTEEQEPSTYIRLFEKKELSWDKEDVDTNSFNYLDVVGNDGVLERLKIFIERKNLFNQYRINRAVDYLLENEDLTQDFFKFYNFLPKKDELRDLRTRVSQLQNLINQLESLNNNTLDQTIDLETYEFIPAELKVDFAATKKELLSGFQELSGLDRIYSDISRSRNELIGEITILREAGTSISECILCGYDWGNIEELFLQIENKSEQIKVINSDKSNRLQESFVAFKSGTVKHLIDIIKEDLSKVNYNEEFVTRLLETEINRFNDVIKSFEFLKVDYSQYLGNEQLLDVSALFDRFKNAITPLKDDSEMELIETYFLAYFREYFDNEFNQIDAVPVENIEAKKRYLSHKWSLNQNQLLQDKSTKLLEVTKSRDEARETSQKLNGLKNIYNASLKSYQKKIIKDIEIVFHVYSGRIMQSFQGGIGLFIFSEKDGIRFQTDSNKTYDAVFTMSSGQLSALIIAFTLALHKKYSQNKIVLIDDPVQTMDELNMYGFIDLLRNEFSDNQIVMSTHEDMMSAFMRYKFKNYNLNEKRLNLKEIS